MADLVIFGDQNFAEVAHYYFTHDSPHRVVAFSVDGAYLTRPSYCGLPVVPFEELPARYPASDCQMFVAVGIAEVNELRAAKVAAAEAAGYRLASFVSSRALVPPDLELKPNTMIMEGSVLQPQVRVGKNCMLWSTTRLGFRTAIGDHCWVVCAIFGEGVEVGPYSFVGLNATVAPGLKLGRSSLIGAGALVMKDTPDYAVLKGVASEVSRVPSSRLWR